MTASCTVHGHGRCLRPTSPKHPQTKKTQLLVPIAETIVDAATAESTTENSIVAEPIADATIRKQLKQSNNRL
jgi:hypothetical protein